MIFSFNIMNSNNKSLNGAPIIWDLETVSEFTKGIRDNCLDIANYGALNYSTLNKMYLAISVYEDINDDEYNENHFYVSMSNVREYKKYIKMRYSDIRSEYEMKQRNLKIEDLGI